MGDTSEDLMWELWFVFRGLRLGTACREVERASSLVAAFNTSADFLTGVAPYHAGRSGFRYQLPLRRDSLRIPGIETLWTRTVSLCLYYSYHIC